ncbi:MAG: NfeD family protein [Bacteroidota bacterium]
MLLGIIITLIVLGLILILLELFVTPGFVTGLLGAVAWVYALYKIYNNYGTQSGHFALAGLILLLLACIIIAVKSGFWNKVSLHENIDGKVNEMPDVNIGDTGTTISALRPSGKVNVNGKSIEASTMGEMIETGAYVEITKIENNKITVKQLSV